MYINIYNFYYLMWDTNVYDIDTFVFRNIYVYITSLTNNKEIYIVKKIKNTCKLLEWAKVDCKKWFILFREIIYY